MRKRGLKGKRAETSGAGAATLVILIAALILLYILFLPPDLREELLEEDSRFDDDEEDEDRRRRLRGKEGNKTILSESPGRIDHLEEKEVDYTLPEVRLFTETSGQLLYEQDSAYLRKSWFSERVVVQQFRIDDLKQYKNFLLSFNAREYGGRVVVKINGEIVSTKVVESFNVPPIKVNRDFLKEGSNSIEFSLEGVGLSFWKVQETTLESLRLTGDFTDISAREASTSFRMSDEEFDNLERARMRYFVDCFLGEPGVLRVRINRALIDSSVPECDTTSPPRDITEYLRRGENEVDFDLQTGSISVFNLQIKAQLEEPTNPIYYFELEEEDYEDVLEDDVNLTLNIDFVDNDEFNNGRIVVNKHIISITTRDDVFETNIDPFIFRGTNAVEIVADEDTDLDILKLKLTITYP